MNIVSNFHFSSTRLGLLLFLFCFLFAACNKNKIDITYKISGVTATNMDNSGASAVASNSVYEKAYVMGLKFNYTVLSGDTGSRYNYDDLNTSCTNKPVAVNVYCMQNFDANHPAHTSMNDIFIPGPGISSNMNNLITNFHTTGHSSGLAPAPQLWLMSAPTSTGNYNFVFDILFDDGVTYSDTTALVYLHL